MSLNAHPILDELSAGQVITPAQYQAALVKLTLGGHESEPFRNLGEGLVWLLEAELLTSGDLDELERTHHAEANFATNATRKRTIEEFLAIADNAKTAKRIEFKKQFWAQLLPGPGWAWMLAVPWVLLFAGWYNFAPSSTPACGDANVKKTVVLAVFEARKKQFPSLDPSEARHDLLSAQLKGVKEIGYIKAERSRGCSATLEMDDLQVPMTYTVSPTQEGREYMVSSGDARVVNAKYGQAKDGELPEGGQPIGAAALRAAFTDAVAAFEKRYSPPDAAGRSRQKKLGGDSETDLPTVRSVIPLGPCAPIESGRYSCRLQVQYNDSFMNALNRKNLQVFEGDFAFEQQAGQWRMAPGFDEKFIDAKTRARIEDLQGEETARALERIQRDRDSKSAPASSVDR